MGIKMKVNAKGPNPLSMKKKKNLDSNDNDGWVDAEQS
jgi:hypothetical protein